MNGDNGPTIESIIVDMDNTITNLTLQYKRAEVWGHLTEEERYKEEEFEHYPPSANYTKEAYDKLKPQITGGNFYSTMEAFPKAIEAIKWLISSRYDVWFCTIDLPVEIYGESNFKEEKREWICKMFGMDYRDRVIFERDKSKCKGRFLIDDDPQIISQMEHSTWEAILVNRKYNEHLEYHKRVSIETMKEDLIRILEEDGSEV